MSLWADLTDDVNASIIDAFGVAASFIPQGATAAIPIVGVIQNPAMLEDFGAGSVQGTGVVRLFVDFAKIQPPPGHGDTVVLNGLTYMITEVEADTNGAAVLKLRIT